MNQLKKIPYHLGIIIDGNRRWAKKRHLPTIEGHRRGFNNVIKIARAARERGVKILTIYTFSSENWQRPKNEVKYLMELMAEAFSKRYIEELLKDKIKLKVIGNKGKLPNFLQEKIEEAERLTEKGKKGILMLAISYGGREEIIEAVKKIVSQKIKPDEIDEEMIKKYLWTGNLSYPDLIIRTGGEKRLSNFLIWQSAYSELYFSDKFWPDFGIKDLEKAFLDYSKRQRRFGR